MTVREKISALVITDSQQPSVDVDGVPRCTTDECCQFDGKRCRAIGWRPSSVCEPAVLLLVKRFAS